MGGRESGSDQWYPFGLDRRTFLSTVTGAGVGAVSSLSGVSAAESTGRCSDKY
jgi:heme O synthase-like polyprenyltransferase